MRYADSVREEARRLKDLGFSYRKIGFELGVNHITAARWCTGKRYKARRDSRLVSRLRSASREMGTASLLFTGQEVERYRRSHDGMCDLCGKEPNSRGLCIEHSHEDGRFGGLVCYGCNRVLHGIETYLKNKQQFDTYLRGQK